MEAQAETASQYLLHTHTWPYHLSPGRHEALGQVRLWHLPPFGKSMGAPRAERDEEVGCTDEKIDPELEN